MGRELSTLYANLHDQGISGAAKYAAFRWIFSVHSRPVSWLFSRIAPYPLMIEVEISTACGLRCRHCELGSGSAWGQPAKLMPFEQFEKILGDFPRLLFIDLTGIGDSLLHPRYRDMMAAVRCRGIYTEAFEHFNGWDESMTDFMLDIGLNRVQPSIDGATKQTYEYIREGGNFDVVCKNLRHLFAEKKRRGLRLPIIDFHFIVCDANEHEMVSFVGLVRQLAGDQRVGIQFTEVLREFPGIKVKKVPITEKRMAEVRAEARRQGVQVWFNRNSEGRPKADMRDCSAWLMPFIPISGDVFPCCARNESADRPGQIARSMGNILQRPFRAIWEGEQYTTLRSRMRRGGQPDYCQGCPVFKAQHPPGTT